MVQEPQSKTWIVVIAAIIGTAGVICAAIIGLGMPFAQKMAENYFDTPEPVYIVVTETSVIKSEPTSAVPIPQNPIIVPATQHVPATQQPILITACPSPSSYAIDAKSLKPNMVVAGPATIHPFEGTGEIAKSINMDWVPRWGINIPEGTSVTIPATVILLSGSTYTPDGTISIFSDNARMEAAQRCWLLNHP